MRPILFAAVVLTLSACDRIPTPPGSAEAPAESAAATSAPAPVGAPDASSTTAAASLTAAGPAAAITPEPQEPAQAAASVVRVDPLANQDDHSVKLYGVGGGDPAMNGLYTYVAFFEGADTGWKVFRIGDVLDYRILSERPGRVDLELTESVQLGDTGDIGSRKRRVIVGWDAPVDEGSPDGVTVTPAR